MTKQRQPPVPPSRWALLGEARTALDLTRMWLPLAGAYLQPPVAARPFHVIVVPGFGAGDRSTLPLRRYLNRRGFPAEGWGLGTNRAGVDLPHTLADLSERWDVSAREDYNGEASVPYLCDRLTDRVTHRFRALQRPIALVGWSLGGYLARETARDLPEIVSQVVTMGSPTIGGPKYTAAAGFFRQRAMDLDWIESEIEKRESRPIRQPITAIYSKSDAVVGWRATQDHYSANVRHIEIDAAHLGMGFNPTIWSVVTDALERQHTPAD